MKLLKRSLLNLLIFVSHAGMDLTRRNAIVYTRDGQWHIVDISCPKNNGVLE